MGLQRTSYFPENTLPVTLHGNFTENTKYYMKNYLLLLVLEEYSNKHILLWS